MRTRALLLLCGISLLWGSGWIVSPLLAQVSAPFAANAFTLGIAAFVTAGITPVLRLTSRLSAVPKHDRNVPLRASALLGLAMLAGPLALLILAQGHGIAGWVPLLYAALPLLAGVGTEAWSPAMIVAVGAALIMLNGTVPLTGSKALWAMPALAAVATQAFALRYARRNLQRVSLRTLLRSLALQCALAAVLLAAGSWLLDPSPRLAPLAQWNVFSAFSLSLLAIFGTALAYAGLYALLARGTLQPRQIAATQWLQVLVFFAESAFFARVRPPWLSLGAAAILVACCWSVLQASPEVDSKPITLRDTSLD